MAISMNMTWKDVTVEQYEAVRARVGWEVNHPPGGVVHTCWFEGSDMRVMDVWDSAEAFNAFVQERLMPAVAELGLPGEPHVVIHPAHALFIAPTAKGF